MSTVSSSSASGNSREESAKGYVIVPIPPTPFGKYTIIGKLGHGGMAEVNLAVVGGKAGFRKLFVVKRLHAHLEAEPGFVEMFLDEARLAAQLDHPNCVQTVEVGEAEGIGPTGARMTQHFLAMEYLNGQGLERLLRITGQRGDVLPIAASVRMIADALDGLGYAHDLRGYDGTPLGVVHRDISPQNIFVTYAGVVKLLDFGIAKAESNVVETRTGIVKGKYAYIAPEQALAAPVDRRADLWSMGVVLWEMLTSRRLFKSVNELATLNETLRGEIRPPSHYNPAVPRELDAAVLRALQRDVDERYATAAEFKDALEAWLDTQPDPPDRKAIAALMKERFGDIIEQHQQRLRECIAAVADDSRSVDRLVLGGGHSTMTSLETEALPSGSHHSVPLVSSAALPVVTPGAGLAGTSGRFPGVVVTPTPSPHSFPGVSVSGTISSSGVSPAVSGEVNAYRPDVSGRWSGIAPADLSTERAVAREARARTLGLWLAVAAVSAMSAVLAVLAWTWLSGTPQTSSASMSAGTPSSPSLAAPGSSPAGVQGGTTTPAAPEPSSPVAPGATTFESGATAPPATLSTSPSTSLPTASTPSEVAAPGGVATRPEERDEPGANSSSRRRARSASTPTVVTPSPPLAATSTSSAPPEVPPPPEPPPPPRGQGYLSLRTSPWTEVFLEGRSLGETPLVRVPLPPGTHVLRLRNRDQGIDESYTVTIRVGETTSQTLGLR